MSKSTADLIVLGVDPGPLAGVVGLRYSSQTRQQSAAPVVVQVSANALLPVLRALMPAGCQVVLAYEMYVVSARSARASNPTANALTRSVCGQLSTLGSDHVFVMQRSMGQISEWASDARLTALGVFELTKQMRHARSAARHAAYSAKVDLQMPDPLSRRFQRIKEAPQENAECPA
jgi:hypothetical protein